MTATNIAPISTSRPFLSCLTASSILLASLCASGTVQAASPYVELYKNNGTTTNVTTTNTPSVPAARITQTQRITPHASTTTSVNTTNNTSVNDPSATTTTPSVRVITTHYDNANTTLTAIDLLTANLPQIPTPQLSVSDISYIPTVLIPQTQNDNGAQLNVSLLDDFINEINPHARHYPPKFDNVSQRYNSKIKLKELESWLRPYADAPNASFDVLIRASQLNSMARNLDSGSDYAIRASSYIARALDRQPNNAEANFLYGMMLSEGGGFKEGKKYLDKAASLGYMEAEQSLAQADLLTDRRSEALSRLRRLSRQYPDNNELQKQINIVENGDYYIWNLPKTVQ